MTIRVTPTKSMIIATQTTLKFIEHFYINPMSDRAMKIVKGEGQILQVSFWSQI